MSQMAKGALKSINMSNIVTGMNVVRLSNCLSLNSLNIKSHFIDIYICSLLLAW